jgi:hypothetical protein
VSADRLRMDLEAAARKLSAREAEMCDLQTRLADAVAMNARYQSMLDRAGLGGNAYSGNCHLFAEHGAALSRRVFDERVR